LKNPLQISLGVPENNDNRISSEKHLTDEPILVNRECLFLSFAGLWDLQQIKKITLAREFYMGRHEATENNWK